RAVPLYAAQRVAVGAQQQELLGSVGGASTVRVFRLEDEHAGRVGARSRAAVDLALRGVRLVTRFYARLNLAEFVGLSAVLLTGFLLVRGGSVSIGTAGAAALYFHNLFAPINIALGLADDAQRATASLSRLVGVADAASPLPERESGDDAAREAGRGSGPDGVPVEVRGVRYSYRTGHPVLHGVDLRITEKERVALVGASGAGKTTLAKLVAGVHRPDEGTAVTTGTVGLVTQEVHVFAGPLADDLRLARPDADDAELRAALARVGALDWALALPQGLDTVVGESGHRLTAAQAQQLALARLVLADPSVVVLDEATAEAGSAGARELEAAAAAAVEGRTALVVAHRLTQAAAAARIVVLDGGRVVETGTHEELVGAGGGCAALWRSWPAGRGTRPGARRAPTGGRRPGPARLVLPVPGALHGLDEAAGAQVGPVLLHVLQAGVAGVLAEHGAPAGRDVRERRPQRVLALVVDQDEVAALRVLERVGAHQAFLLRVLRMSS